MELENNIIIEKEELTKFRLKYNLNSIEMCAILGEKEYGIRKIEEEGNLHFKNPQLVRMILDDGEELKELIQSYYESGKINQKIYLKFFKQEEKDIKAREMGEGLIEFKKKYNISYKDMASILGVREIDLKKFEKGEINSLKTVVDLKMLLSNPDDCIKTIREARDRKKIPPQVSGRIVESIIIKRKEENGEKLIKKRERLKMSKEKIHVEDTKKTRERRENENSGPHMTKLDRMRISAKKELRQEEELVKESSEKREDYINCLIQFCEDGYNLTQEDIDIVKNTILYHQNLATNYTLKLVIFGTLKLNGVDETLKVMNRLSSELNHEKYGEKLTRFRIAIRNEANKRKIKELKGSGYSDEEIMEELNMKSYEYNKLINKGDER